MIPYSHQIEPDSGSRFADYEILNSARRLKLSIIIPALNEEATIERAIVSSWGVGACEVIVADGGSVDQTVDISKRCQATVIGCTVRGRGTQLNAGAKAAKGDVLLFLHADNWLAGSIGSQLAAFFDQMCESYACFQQRIEASGWIYRAIERGNAMRVRYQKLPYGDQGICVSKDLFESIGGFKEIPLMEDVEFATRLSRVASPKLLAGPIHVGSRRWQKNGPIRQTIKNWVTMFRYRMGASPVKLSESYNFENRTRDLTD